MDSSWLLLTAFLVILGGYTKASSQAGTCGTVGHSNQSEQYEKLTNFRFYLNTQQPVPCSGNVTTWKYCYYTPDIEAQLAHDYRAPFGLYRRNGTNYELVSPMFLISISSKDIGSNSFTCQTFTTPVTFIQQGDVVGTCVYDINTLDRVQSQLNLAGTGGGVTGHSLQYADANFDRCGTGVSVPNSIAEVDLSVLNSTILHLYANIESDMDAITTEIVATTSVPSTTALTTEVTKLEIGTTTESPSIQSGTVTESDTHTTKAPHNIPNTQIDSATTQPGTASTMAATTSNGSQETASDGPTSSVVAIIIISLIAAGALVMLALTCSLLVFKRWKHTAAMNPPANNSYSVEMTEIQATNTGEYVYVESRIVTGDNIPTVENEAYGCSPRNSSTIMSTEQNAAYSATNPLSHESGEHIYDCITDKSQKTDNPANNNRDYHETNFFIVNDDYI